MAVFNEDTRVKIPATIQFLRLGYNYQSLKDADIDFQTKVFINRFRPALERINGREFSYDEIKEILMDINNVIKNNDLGKEFYNWLINPLDKVKLIDFEDITKNDFAVVDELPYCIVEGTEVGSFRPDVNILINGMPLSFLEVKKPNNDGGIQKEFERMINQRLQNPEYKKFFNMLQFISFSNNMEYEDADDAEDVKAGSFYTTPNGQNTSFSFFREDDEMYHINYPYKEVSMETIKYVLKDCGYNPAEADTPEFAENLQVNTPCNSFITSVFDMERFLYFIQYGMMFINGKVPEKHIMRYPQFFATRKIIERLENGGKGGIIWHTRLVFMKMHNRIWEQDEIDECEYLEQDWFAEEKGVPIMMRIDCDVKEHVDGEHAVTHLTLSNHETCRIPMKEIPTFSEFIRFVLFHFYGKTLKLKENRFDGGETITELEKSMIHMYWN